MAEKGWGGAKSAPGGNKFVYVKVNLLLVITYSLTSLMFLERSTQE